MAGVYSDPKHGNQVIHNATTDTSAKRLSVVREGGTTYTPYSDGTEIIMEKTAQGDGKRLKEVRTVTRVNTPKTRVFGGIGEVKYDRGLIYRGDEKEKETT